jgi:hypothetical protein
LLYGVRVAALQCHGGGDGKPRFYSVHAAAVVPPLLVGKETEDRLSSRVPKSFCGAQHGALVIMVPTTRPQLPLEQKIDNRALVDTNLAQW